jgi:pimeloyl-ACP methyl ester carboxylesterase
VNAVRLIVGVWLVFGALAAVAAPSDAREEFIDEPVFQGKAYVQRAGLEHDRLVVLVHGIGEQGARDWRALIPELATEYQVLTFDLPGFARSDKANALYSPEKYVAFMSFVIEKYAAGRRFALIGHSLGAALSLRYAGTYPDRVETLVLADVPGILNRMAYSHYLSHIGIRQLPAFYPRQGEQLTALAGNLLGMVERSRFDPEGILNNSALRERLLQSDPAKIAGLALVLDDFGQHIRSVTAPTLLIWGAEDRLAPLRTAKVLAANLPDARLEVLPGVGHAPMAERPEAFNELVLKQLRSPGAAGLRYALPADDRPIAVRPGECVKSRNRAFQGDYDTLVIRGCRGAVVRNARVRSLRIYDSTVEIESSRIGGMGPEAGLRADGSEIGITASVIEADVAITAVDAKLDLAGVRVVGREQAVRAPAGARLVFSVSEIDSPLNRGRIHRAVSVDAQNPM